MTTILIVDDHWLYASALGQEVQGVLPDARWLHAGSLADALAHLSQERTIEYIFLDLKLPDARSLEALHAIRRAAPDAKVAIVSAYEDVRMMREAYDAGAIGYLPKAGDPSEFKRALAQLLTGGFYFPAQIFEPASATATDRGLTPRETDVLNERVCCARVGLPDGEDSALRTGVRHAGAALARAAFPSGPVIRDPGQVKGVRGIPVRAW